MENFRKILKDALKRRYEEKRNTQLLIYHKTQAIISINRRLKGSKIVMSKSEIEWTDLTEQKWKTRNILILETERDRDKSVVSYVQYPFPLKTT